MLVTPRRTGQATEDQGERHGPSGHWENSRSFFSVQAEVGACHIPSRSKQGREFEHLRGWLCLLTLRFLGLSWAATGSLCVCECVCMCVCVSGRQPSVLHQRDCPELMCGTTGGRIMRCPQATRERQRAWGWSCRQVGVVGRPWAGNTIQTNVIFA